MLSNKTLEIHLDIKYTNIIKNFPEVYFLIINLLLHSILQHSSKTDDLFLTFPLILSVFHRESTITMVVSACTLQTIKSTHRCRENGLMNKMNEVTVNNLLYR